MQRLSQHFFVAPGLIIVPGNSMAFGKAPQRGGEALTTNSNFRAFGGAMAMATWA